MEEKKTFKIEETDETVSHVLKQSIVSELDTIRNSSAIIELFSTSMLSVLSKAFSTPFPEEKDIENN
ncbi:MAG: hypothetical protein KA313_10845 [Pseudarcicella sp.]|nr:hypothetical protein [Pseudarcicella sp.]MBP6411587.1 hypothetical protein [Pseudarcicella sp.]